MKESIFKVGDRVYDIMFGWGIVVDLKITEYPPLTVQFSGGRLFSYTHDGNFYDSDKVARLSFTEYDFVKGGFSQERPLPDIKVGDPIWVKQHGDEYEWCLKRFNSWLVSEYGKSIGVKVMNQFDNNTWNFLEYSLTQPKLKEV